MSTSAAISPTASQQSPGSAQLPSMNLSALDTKRTTSKSASRYPDKVTIRVQNLPPRQPYRSIPVEIVYLDHTIGKRSKSITKSHELTRSQIGKNERFPTLRLRLNAGTKVITIPGNATSRVPGTSITITTGADGTRTIRVPGKVYGRPSDPPIIITMKPSYNSKPSVPTTSPKPIHGNNTNDGKWGDVYGVTYKKDGKGNVVIEGYARVEKLLIYDEKAKRWVLVRDKTRDDKDGKDNGVIRFRFSVKAGNSVSLFSVTKDSKGKTAAGTRLATLYTTANPKRDKTDGAVVLAPGAGGIAAGGAAAGKGAIGIGKGTATTIGGAVAANGVRNPPKPKPEKPTMLQLITTAMRPVEQAISRSDSFRSALSQLSRSDSTGSSMRSAFSSFPPSPARSATADEVAQMQRNAGLFAGTLGPFLNQMLVTLTASGLLTGVAALIGLMYGKDKVLNGGRPATISLFAYSHLKDGRSGDYKAATGPGPYFGFSPANTITSNTSFSVSFATPDKLSVNGKEIGFGISLTWSIDTAEKNDTGWVGDKPSYVFGAFGYLLGGKFPTPSNPVDAPLDRRRNRAKFYIGLENDTGAQVRYRPGRKEGERYLFAAWTNALATVASLNRRFSKLPVLLFGPIHAPAAFQKLLDKKTTPPSSDTPTPKKGPTRELTAVLQGFDNKFWKKRETRDGKTVHDLLKGVTLINTKTDKRHFVEDGKRPVKGEKRIGLNFDYDSGGGKRNPNGVTMRYRGGKNGVQHPNEVIFHLGNGMKIHVQFNNLWNSAAKGKKVELKKIYIHYGPNQRLQVDQNWVKNNLTATFKDDKVTLINKFKNNAPRKD